MRIKSTLTCKGKKVLFGDYLIIWGPGEDDRAVSTREPNIGPVVNSGAPVLYFTTVDKLTGNERYLHFYFRPVMFVRELEQKNFYDRKGEIICDTPDGQLKISIVYISTTLGPYQRVLARSAPGFLLEYTFFFCPIMFDLRA